MVDLPDKDEQKVVEAFQKLSFRGSWPTAKRYGAPVVYWRGHAILKQPSDLMVYQEIIHDTKPDLIVETGTMSGGSATFFADMMQLNGLTPNVISIDTVRRENRPEHHGVLYITGSSVDNTLVKFVFAGANNVLVSLDSDHAKDHVLQELDIYAPYLKTGNYMVVEDTSLNGHPVDPQFGDGPYEALEEWLPKHPEFIPDPARERFLLTSNPYGFLKRI